MKKLLVMIVIVFFTTALYGMEEQKDEKKGLIASHRESSDLDYQKLVYHVASLVVLSKVNHKKENKPCNYTCCTYNLADYLVDQSLLDNLERFAEYGEFLKKNGCYASDIKHAIKTKKNIDESLEAYREETIKKAIVYRTIELPEHFKKDICAMLTKKQKKFFQKHIVQQLNSLEYVWRLSRAMILESLWEVNTGNSLYESSVLFCDKGFSYAPGICTGLGVGSFLFGNGWVLGTLLLLCGVSSCVALNGHVISDLNVKCSTYIDNRKYKNEKKLRRAIFQIVSSVNSGDIETDIEKETEEIKEK